MAGSEKRPVLPSLSPEAVRAMGAAAGLDIDDERLPAVVTVLTELLGLSARLEPFDLEGVDPDAGDPQSGWEGRR